LHFFSWTERIETRVFATRREFQLSSLDSSGTDGKFSRKLTEHGMR
jgi:hypothetical protein